MYKAGAQTKTCHTQSCFTDGLFWTVGEALVKIISNHGGAFIIGDLLSLPPCQIMTVLEKQTGDLHLNPPLGESLTTAGYALKASHVRVTPDGRWL